MLHHPTFTVQVTPELPMEDFKARVYRAMNLALRELAMEMSNKAEDAERAAYEARR